MSGQPLARERVQLALDLRELLGETVEGAAGQDEESQRRGRHDRRQPRITEGRGPLARSKLAEDVTRPELLQPISVDLYLYGPVEHDIEVAGAVPALHDRLTCVGEPLLAERALASEIDEAAPTGSGCGQIGMALVGCDTPGVRERLGGRQKVEHAFDVFGGRRVVQQAEPDGIAPSQARRRHEPDPAAL